MEAKSNEEPDVIDPSFKSINELIGVYTNVRLKNTIPLDYATTSADVIKKEIAERGFAHLR